MPFNDTIDEIVGSLPLFETVSERDRFLKGSVGLVRNALNADMAAVFIYDGEAGDLAFSAGVDADGIWDRVNCPGFAENRENFRFSLDGNDVGRAFTEGRVIRLVYKETDDDHPFGSKMIIPIARGPLRSGVLVLGGKKTDTFDGLGDGEVLAAVTRLGDLLDDASSLISRADGIDADRKTVITGRKAGDGIALGQALLFWSSGEMEISAAEAGTPEEELQAFESALERSVDQLQEIHDKAESGVSETGALIFLAQILMLRDNSFTDAMRELIRDGVPAVEAVGTVVEDYAARFAGMTEQRLAEKAQDVRDLGFRLTTVLSGKGGEEFSYKGRIALARHIYPTDLFRLSLEGVAGVVLMGAAVTAHISILARSLGLPVLITDDKNLLAVRRGSLLALDADAGRLYLEPSDNLVKEFSQRLARVEEDRTAYTLRGRTSDGTYVSVLANINILKDAEDARIQGAEGIGLYRSEFPFILKNDILSEEQQFQIYRSIAETQGSKPLTFRTADIGGDKILQGREEPEENPFLGVRGIRFSLAHREMFRDQLRAMLRAGAGKDLGIMLPMVSGVEEVLEAKEELERCKADLRLREVPFNSEPRIGAMVELPSAALSVRELAAETDFLSIGTNDLTMYLLAVDRTNENLSHLYRSHHPTVLRTLARIVEDAADFNSDISVCGDAAADPTLTPFFVGIGIRKLSVSPGNVEPLKQRLAAWSLKDAEKTASEMLAIGRVSEMESYLRVPQPLQNQQ